METEEEITLQEQADLAVIRGKVFGFLASIYGQLPGPGLVQGLMDGGMMTLLDALTANELAGDAEMVEGLKLVKAYLQANRDTPAETMQTELAVDRTRLLRGVKPGYGPPPAYESVWAGSVEYPRVEASVSVVRAYADAGVGMADGVHDQPDFIGLELDFMRLLAEKEAKACQKGDEREVRRILESEEAFLQQHIVAWIPACCDVLAKEARTDFFRGIARLTKGFVQDEAAKTTELLEKAQDEPAE
jgi:TorA maturation chaperone TorD